MQTRINPPRETWDELCQRPSLERGALDETVRSVFEQVKQGGDSALLALTEMYDGVILNSVKIPILSEATEAVGLRSELKDAIDTAYQNIWKFHIRQAESEIQMVETQPGVECWQESRAIERVGLYVPGGSAPLISTMLMLGVPAQIGGCKDVVVCTPPDKYGDVNTAIRYAAAKCGIETIYSIGGAQAIAAMTFGTSTIPKVSKLFGPGNQYVTSAKEYAGKYGIAIDMPAGPSEVLVLSDKTARADFVAADLLSQAEHGLDSQVILVTTSRQLQKEVKKELIRQIRLLPRSEIAKKALQNSLSIYFDSLEEAFDFANVYAPEHWILQIKNAKQSTDKVLNAGSVFIGLYSPESAGDYASGTNHTLPTGGWAKSYSGLSCASFQRVLSFQAISKQGLKLLQPAIETLAIAEGLAAHARAVSIRINDEKA